MTYPNSPPTALPDGWYPDPAQPTQLRWWTGSGWTEWIHDSGSTALRPLPERQEHPALAQFPARAAWWGLLGALMAVVVGSLLSLVVTGTVSGLIAGVFSLYGVMALTVVGVSYRYGSGNLFRDLGIRLKWSDLGTGIAASVGARAVGLAAVIIYLYVSRTTGDTDPGQFDAYEDSDLAIILFMATALLFAPVFEEIFFRGFLQSALMTRAGAPLAIAIASLLFGAVHLNPDNGATANILLFTITAIAGAAFGFSYWATKRLGTAIVAHFFFNLVPVIVIAYERW